MIKKILLLFMFIFCIFIYWCFSENYNYQTFDKFKIWLDEKFKVFDSSLIDDKQITNKIIFALKNKNDSWFIENILISKDFDIKNISIEDLVNLNIKKSKEKIVWLENVEQETIKFVCNWNNISWIYVIFELSDTLKDDSAKNYVWQFYYINDQNWYTISYISNNKENIQAFSKNLKTLNCN